MADNKGPTGVPETPNNATAAGSDRGSLRVDLWLFVVMLALALVGVGMTQVEITGGRLYWLFLVVVYAAVSVVRAWLQAKRQGQPVWRMIRAQVFHWLGALMAINIVLVFEARDIAGRGPAADFSLLILALSCYLAGVHFNWIFLLLGGVLAVIAVGLGYLDQLSVFMLALPLAALGVWIVLKRKLAPASRP